MRPIYEGTNVELKRLLGIDQNDTFDADMWVHGQDKLAALRHPNGEGARRRLDEYMDFRHRMADAINAGNTYVQAYKMCVPSAGVASTHPVPATVVPDVPTEVVDQPQSKVPGRKRDGLSMDPKNVRRRAIAASKRLAMMQTDASAATPVTTPATVPGRRRVPRGTRRGEMQAFLETALIRMGRARTREDTETQPRRVRQRTRDETSSSESESYDSDAPPPPSDRILRTRPGTQESRAETATVFGPAPRPPSGELVGDPIEVSSDEESSDGREPDPREAEPQPLQALTEHDRFDQQGSLAAVPMEDSSDEEDNRSESGYSPTSPTYSPTSPPPTYRPTSPIYSPTSPTSPTHSPHAQTAESAAAAAPEPPVEPTAPVLPAAAAPEPPIEPTAPVVVSRDLNEIYVELLNWAAMHELELPEDVFNVVSDERYTTPMQRLNALGFNGFL
jgi:hypothetical protein